MYTLQIIALVIYAVVLLSATRDFKRTVLVWVPMSLMFNSQVCVYYDSPATSLTVAVDISLVLYYFVVVRRDCERYGLRSDNFFFSPAIIVMLVSYILALFFSTIPFHYSFNKTVKTFLDQFGMIILFFRCLDSRDDIELFLKVSSVIAIIAVLNGLVELTTHINPIGDFVYYTSPHDAEGRGWYIPYAVRGVLKMRFGMVRCFSFFGLHLVFGFACCLWLFMSLFCKENDVVLFKRIPFLSSNAFQTIMIVMCMIGCILSTSKGPLLCMSILLLTRYRISDIFNVRTMFPICVIIAVVLIFFPEYINIILSLFDENIAAEGGGSTIEMRKEQLELALKIFKKNPLTGSGINSADYFKSAADLYMDLRGSESVWLKLLPDQGVVGVVAYLIMYVVLFRYCRMYIPTRILFFYLAAIFIFDTTNGNAVGLLIWWVCPLLTVLRFYQLPEEVLVTNFSDKQNF